MVDERLGNPPEADSSPAEDRVARGFRVYGIRSQTTGAFYIGQTSDLEGRLRQHNDPKTSGACTQSAVVAPGYSSTKKYLDRDQKLWPARNS